MSQSAEEFSLLHSAFILWGIFKQEQKQKYANFYNFTTLHCGNQYETKFEICLTLYLVQVMSHLTQVHNAITTLQGEDIVFLATDINLPGRLT